MKYYFIENYGEGFITHEDNERCYISGWPGNIWATQSNGIWAQRVNALEKTKEEAQAIVDTALIGITYPPGFPNAGEQVIIVLPDNQSC
jgi:hypothetical protein